MDFETLYHTSPELFPDLRNIKTIPKMIERRKKVQDMLKSCKDPSRRTKLSREYNYLIAKQFLYSKDTGLHGIRERLHSFEMPFYDIWSDETLGSTKEQNKRASQILWDTVAELAQIPEFRTRFYKTQQI